MKPFLKHFGVEGENGLSFFCGDFASKEELKHELEYFSKEHLKSNKGKIFDHSDSDQEIINEEYIDEDVFDNTT